ncbi:hypothetical protein COO60DRAFT_830292 [Scenedesmus sp. NREL 46B-D3]|nr:hypothetical protein COO60DRAFT_830292 [Scenedesmus sp. NREL 46B-D3]
MHTAGTAAASSFVFFALQASLGGDLSLWSCLWPRFAAVNSTRTCDHGRQCQQKRVMLLQHVALAIMEGFCLANKEWESMCEQVV